MDHGFEHSDAWLQESSIEDLRRIIDAFYRVHRLALEATDYDAVLESILSESLSVANAEASSLLLYDEDRNDLYFSHTGGESSEGTILVEEFRLSLDQGIAGEAATHRKIVNVRDAQNDPRIHREADETTGFVTRSLLAVPMVDRGRLIGVLEVLNKLGSDGFSEADERTVEMFASLVASVVSQARMIQENLQSERLAAIGQTVAGLSHYTKNILMGIQGSVELIEEGKENGDEDTFDTAWGILKRNAGRLSNVVNDMLTYSKEREPVRETCSMDQLIDDVLATAAPVIEQKKVTVERAVNTQGRQIVLDTNGIHRCLLNLVLNGVDAVPNGTGKIRVWVEIQDRAVVIGVDDNGSGIDADVIHTLFRPFVSTKGSRGTGLGLAVSHKIAVEHGGEIEASNHGEGGARFTVTLPLEINDKELIK